MADNGETIKLELTIEKAGVVKQALAVAYYQYRDTNWQSSTVEEIARENMEIIEPVIKQLNDFLVKVEK